MATFILKWNPAISSFKMEDCTRLCEEFPFGLLNWSVWEHENAHRGDDFYMVRVGDGVNGIFMHGTFASEPQSGQDWSGKGRKTYYCDLDIDFIVDTEAQPILTSDVLEKAIPDFDWRRGHSGVALTAGQEKLVDDAFAKYRKKNKAVVDELAKKGHLDVQKSAIDSISGGELWTQIFDWIDDELDRYTSSATHDCVNLSFSMDYNEHEFRLAVLFCGDSVLHIKCKNLFSLKTDLCSGAADMSWFKLSKPYRDAYIIESNGIKLVCGVIEFEKVTPYTNDFIPVTI